MGESTVGERWLSVGQSAEIDARAAGTAAAEAALTGPDPKLLVLFCSDDYEYEAPLVGGCAGDGLKMQATFQFHGDRVLQHGVVGAAIASDAPLGIGVRHGWRRVGEPMLVTGSEANRVHTLEDRPALDLYLQRL